jgi:hypothetical protein
MNIDRQTMELRLLLANSVSKKEVLEYTAKIKELQYIKKMLFDSENYKTEIIGKNNYKNTIVSWRKS